MAKTKLYSRLINSALLSATRIEMERVMNVLVVISEHKTARYHGLSDGVGNTRYLFAVRVYIALGVIGIIAYY